ncbi:MAG: 3-deoxy-7-phosphoheptulonate synthase [Sedimentisphaerales bacterium]|nr:3-deoxy-7-phosphoheptulonate synthase [Sedimentisphaerales bacterium]
MELTDNLNIKQFKPLLTPAQLKEELPQTDQESVLVAGTRRQVADILTNPSDRRMVIVGPCSLHDRDASLKYAEKLRHLQDNVGPKLLLIMRAYFEKPRTTLGWKGMLYDPGLDGSYNIEQGFRMARGLMREIGNIGLPIATEFLDPIVPQYLADMVTWAAIGARTTESQVHRQMASGLSMPIGFKNSTDGNLAPAVDAIKAARSPHSFMGINRDGQVIIAETCGNRYGHLVMRGGVNGPNYASEYVAFARILLQKAQIDTGVVIDCSHANSSKDHRRQRDVFEDICKQIREGDDWIAGIMLESFLEEGSQTIQSGQSLRFGVSLTDKCLGWEDTESLIRSLAVLL